MERNIGFVKGTSFIELQTCHERRVHSKGTEKPFCRYRTHFSTILIPNAWPRVGQVGYRLSPRKIGDPARFHQKSYTTFSDLIFQWLLVRDLIFLFFRNIVCRSIK